MDHISIIIVHYNSDADTKKCLESLAAVELTNAKLTTIVIDNGSREPFQVPKKLSNLNVDLVRSESNLGFTGGNNLGIRHALDEHQPDFVVLLNNDTYVDPKFLQQLYRHAEAHPECGLICPKIYFGKGREYHAGSYTAAERGNVIWYAGGSIDWPNLLAFHRGVDEVDRGHLDQLQRSDFATGCCVLIRREVIEKIGLLDERFFLYFEDVDYSLRARRAGYEIGVCTASKVWHVNAGSSGGAGSPLHQYYQARNRILFAVKHGSSRLRLLAARLVWKWILKGTAAERSAAMDIVLNRWGKRLVL